jgi:ATP-dependent RNA helicase DeaD
MGNPSGPDRRRVNKGGDLQRKLRPQPDGDERPQRGPERPSRGPERPSRGRGSEGRWFTVNVGRSKNADPKWLIPLLCRRGNVTKRAIGKIQVLMRETRVEIAPDAADQFAEAIRRPDEKDRNIHIEPVDE